ncbi:MAG: hypothetical protein IPO43_15040 [Rhodoferax sp.]|nr:hypothetical protein [Rhodoferax sp.]
MKLNIVPARTGMVWAKLGIKTFFRQPLAMAGLFFMFMAVLAVIGSIPVVGGALSMALLPAALVGLMAATRQADGGKFPMPTILLVAFRSGRQQTRAMLLLGVLYAIGGLMVSGITSLVDDGTLAKLSTAVDQKNIEQMLSAGVPTALWVFFGLSMLLSMAFWYAPALVHWHGVPPVKSLFFSLVACWKNLAALAIYNLVWASILLTAMAVTLVIATLVTGPATAGSAVFPVTMLLIAMSMTSIYFTFRDTFDVPPEGES